MYIGIDHGTTSLRFAADTGEYFKITREEAKEFTVQMLERLCPLDEIEGIALCYSMGDNFTKITDVKKLKNRGVITRDGAGQHIGGGTKVFDEIVDAHIHLVNKTYAALKKADPEITLTVCPTQYSGDENGYYISKFGSNIPSDVDLFWTGAEICSRVLTVREADELMRSTKHKPRYWDNYPVNDCEMFQ